MNVFQLSQVTQRRVKRVLEYVVAHIDRGEAYSGDRLKGQGAKHVIDSHSPYEYQIVIDAVEKGKGSEIVLLLLNKYRLKDRWEPVSLTTVYRTIKRLWPVIRKIRKRKQERKSFEFILGKGPLEMGDTIVC
jgi:hypothetical protein